MELNFEGELDIEFDDKCEFSLPPYIVKLSDEDIKCAKQAEDKGLRIVAAGADPSDEKITLITAANKVMVFDAKKFYIPRGIALPSHQGSKLFLPNIGGRWPTPVPGFYVDSSWVIKNSVSALIGASISTNYTHENNVK